MEAAIREFIDAHHADPKPFVWTKTADQILENIARFAQRTLDVESAPLISRTRRSEHSSRSPKWPMRDTEPGFPLCFLERQPYTPDPTARPDFLVGVRFELPRAVAGLLPCRIGFH